MDDIVHPLKQRKNHPHVVNGDFWSLIGQKVKSAPRQMESTTCIKVDIQRRVSVALVICLNSVAFAGK